MGIVIKILGKKIGVPKKLETPANLLLASLPRDAQDSVRTVCLDSEREFHVRKFASVL